MTLRTFDDPARFLSVARAFLEEREDLHGLLLGMLGLAEADAARTPIWMGLAEGPSNPRLAAALTPMNLILSEGDAAAVEPIARALGAQELRVPGVVGPPPLVDAFAKAWSDARGTQVTGTMEQGLYRLDRVVAPGGIPGHARRARAADAQTLVAWLQAFEREALPHAPANPAHVRATVEGGIARGFTYVWESAEGMVATASLARPTRRGITMNAVYTPPEFRGRGYATGLSAAVSQAGLDSGKEFCTLYTDLANPASNGIYRKIGYARVGSSKHAGFGPVN